MMRMMVFGAVIETQLEFVPLEKLSIRLLEILTWLR
jgi:hypothetical protein